MYVYLHPEHGVNFDLYTVGFWHPNTGDWHAESDWKTKEDAANRVHFLNGGNGALIPTATALRELVQRCDGPEGVRADGSNIQTMQAHAVLAKMEGY